MAFPFIFEDSFESGTDAGWDSQTDTAAQLDIVHYSTLAGLPWSTCVPYSGAYAMRCTLSGGTADAFLTEGDMNIAANAVSYFAIPIWFSPDFTGTADDTVNLFELQNGSNVAEVTLGARIVAATDVINLGIGETAATSWSPMEIERGAWYVVEILVSLDAGGGDDGAIDVYITKQGEPAQSSVSATQVGSLDQAAVTHGVLGIQNHLATTTGTILYGGVVQDDARIYPKTRRYDDTTLLTKSGHVFVGAGELENITMHSGAGTDCIVRVFDTDTADTNDATSAVIELTNTANGETVDPAGVPVNLIRGCYVHLEGTTPKATVKTCKTHVFSDATMKNHGMRRG